MTNKIDSKQEHLEGILGEKIAPELVPLIGFIREIAISTVTPSQTTHREFINPFPNICFTSTAIDVSGSQQTQANGQVVFRLSNFLCREGQSFRVVNVLATPISPKPVFLTVMEAIVNNGADVEITVFAWDANGAPVDGVAFNWRVRAELPS